MKNYIFISMLLVGSIFIFNSCNEDDIIESNSGAIMIPEPGGESGELTSFQQKTISYFIDIALGFEFGNVAEITRKWTTDMNIFVTGPDASGELRAELDKIVNELNRLATDGFKINLVVDEADSNYEIFFGSHIQYGNLNPDLVDAVADNFGLFDIRFANDNSLNRGRMYVDTQRTNLIEQKHLLREELTQSLGLAKDSEQYETSIFQSSFDTKVTRFNNLDKELIKLLYHPKMRIGLNEQTVQPILIDILTAN